MDAKGRGKKAARPQKRKVQQELRRRHGTSSQDIGDLIYSIIELIAIKNGTDRGQKSRVINRSILQNDVIYYFGG